VSRTSRYPLQALLDSRERREEEARRAVAGAVEAVERTRALRDAAAAARAAIEEGTRACERDLAASAAEGAAALAGLSRRASWLRRAEACARVRLGVEEGAVREAVERLERRGAALAEARAAVRALERDRDGWRAALRRLRLRAEADAEDDLAAVRGVSAARGRSWPALRST
jgi:hypothetical protein